MLGSGLDLETEEELRKLFRRYPSLPSETILREGTVFLALAPKIFKQHRSARHLARIICSLVWLRHQLREQAVASQPGTLFRTIPSTLAFPFGTKQTLGLCVGVSQLGEYQLFSEKNILQAISSHLPEAQLVEQSPLAFQRPQDSTMCLYLEIEKSSATPFSVAEIKSLRGHLHQSLHNCIEQVTPTLVPIRNEEEKMKDVVALRDEIHALDDPPQVVINLEKQNPAHLSFAVTLVRPVGRRTPPLSQLFQNLSSEWTFTPLRTQEVSLSKDRLKKEAHFFHLQLNNLTPFIRSDSSVNLPLARQHVVDVLTHHLGPVRDYAGGMMFLQNTLFAQLKERYTRVDPKLLEDFYYGCSPTEALLTLPNAAVETLLDLILDLQQAPLQDTSIGKKKNSSNHSFVALRLPQSFPENLLRQHLPIISRLVSTVFSSNGHKIIAYTYPSEDISFLPALEKALREILAQDPSTQTLQLCTEIFPLSLDPRITLLSSTNHIFKMLFDGLMRLDAKGVPQCAVAESYSLSEDRKTYTFKLRESYWNNGDPVTAHDFAYTWKKILSPSFKTPYAYLFYLIKNAKEAKRGDCSIDSVGINAFDPQTLVVQLEHPAPYFLNYLALSLFFPVNHRIDQTHPNWHLTTSNDYICNGPFALSSISPGRSLHLTKNPDYWDHPNVHLQAIHIDIAQTKTILERFQNNQVDWVGVPITHSNPTSKLSDIDEEKHPLHYFSTHWLKVNTKCFPLNNKKFRHALSLAIDRSALVDLLPQGEAIPACSPLPPAYTTFRAPPQPYNQQQAQGLLAEALHEMQVSLSEIPEVSILLAAETRDLRYNLLVQLQNQIYQTLGVVIKIEVHKWGETSGKVIEQEYQLSAVSWQYSINTPYYFLDTFASPQDGDQYQWTSQSYRIALLSLQDTVNTVEANARMAHLEKILLCEYPVIPLFHEMGRSAFSDRVSEARIDETVGIVDFKQAYLTQENPSELLSWL